MGYSNKLEHCNSRSTLFFFYNFPTVYHRQQNICYPKGVYLPISKLHSILAVANSLAHNNKVKFVTAVKF